LPYIVGIFANLGPLDDLLALSSWFHSQTSIIVMQ